MKKMTKVQLVNAITSLAKEMESKLEKERPDMKDIIKYTLNGYYENPRNVERDELLKIAGELEDIKNKNSINTNGTDNKTSGKTTTATTEGNKTTPAGKTTNKNTKKGKISEEEATKRILGVINENSTADKTTTEKGKTSTEKPEASTKKKNGATPKNKPTENKKEVSLFPEILEINNLGKLKLRTDLNSISEIGEAINNNDSLSLVFATYWNKKDLKKFNYDPLGILSKEEYPLEFEKDFDIMQPLHISDSGKVIYAVSVYTDVLNSFLDSDFEQLDGQRFSNGVEFQVYEVVEV